MRVAFPHRYQVLRAYDQRFQSVVVLENAGDGRSHQCLAKSNHVADEDTVPFIQMMGRDFHRCRLEVEQPVTEYRGNLELSKARAGLMGELIRPLKVDVVG